MYVDSFQFKTSFARDIFYSKYAQGPSDTWPNLCRRLINDVCGDRSLTFKETTTTLMSKEDQDQLLRYMVDMAFIPGGRYLYYGGRPAGFFNNCFQGDTQVLTDCGYIKLKDYVGETVNVFSPVEGEYLPAKIYSHGVQKLQKITFKQYLGTGKKYSVIATRNHHWPLQNGTDTYDLRINDVVGALGKRPEENPMGYIHGLVFGDGTKEATDKQGIHTYKIRFCGIKDSLFLPHYLACCQVLSIDYTISNHTTYQGDTVVRIKCGEELKKLPSDEWGTAYIAGFIRGWIDADGHKGITKQLACIHKDALEWFVDNAVCAGIVVTGKIKTQIRDTQFAKNHSIHSINWQNGYEFRGFRVESIEPYIEEEVFCPYEPVYERIIIDYGIDTFNCFTLKAEEDSREEWGNIVKRASDCLMSGGGIGVDYSVLRPSGRTLSRTGGISSGPLPLMSSVNEIGRNVMQGGSRRSAIYASLNWQHEDIQAFLEAKDWSVALKKLKEDDFNFPLPLDMSNISINWDTYFIDSIEREADQCGRIVQSSIPKLWYDSVLKMCSTGEPGHSYNFWENENETLRNACTEFTSEDDSDVCNLGSINLGNIKSLEELRSVVNLASKFLVCGSIRGEVPYEKVKQVREHNRKIGLGLMGVHEWLLQRNCKYEVNDELKGWLDVWRSESEAGANEWSDRFFINRPKKYRAVAPAGTIGILALIVGANKIG